MEKRSIQSFLLALFSAGMLLFALFTIGYGSDFSGGSFSFGFSLPRFEGEALPFLMEVVLLLAPLFAFLFALTLPLLPHPEKALFFPCAFPALYACLRLWYCLKSYEWEAFRNEIPLWIFLFLLLAAALFAGKPWGKHAFWLPVVFLTVETALFLISIFTRRSLSSFYFAYAAYLHAYGGGFYLVRIALSQFLYFVFFGLYTGVLFFPQKEKDRKEKDCNFC